MKKLARRPSGSSTWPGLLSEPLTPLARATFPAWASCGSQGWKPDPGQGPDFFLLASVPPPPVPGSAFLSPRPRRAERLARSVPRPTPWAVRFLVARSVPRPTPWAVRVLVARSVPRPTPWAVRFLVARSVPRPTPWAVRFLVARSVPLPTPWAVRFLVARSVPRPTPWAVRFLVARSVPRPTPWAVRFLVARSVPRPTPWAVRFLVARSVPRPTPWAVRFLASLCRVRATAPPDSPGPRSGSRPTRAPAPQVGVLRVLPPRCDFRSFSSRGPQEPRHPSTSVPAVPGIPPLDSLRARSHLLIPAAFPRRRRWAAPGSAPPREAGISLRSLAAALHFVAPHWILAA
ncbi:BCL-6 corepressor-like protein 1 [Pan troglodytes]|uniref:BCL-6 corepressor-like protein 1 n=1 Tax=Pan troglodytes TaxID=9598 RepID=UPI003013AFB1